MQTYNKTHSYHETFRGKAKYSIQDGEIDYRFGEFSLEAEEAFNKHLHRLYLKTLGVIQFEPHWYSWRPSFLDPKSTRKEAFFETED